MLPSLNTKEVIAAFLTLDKEFLRIENALSSSGIFEDPVCLKISNGARESIKNLFSEFTSYNAISIVLDDYWSTCITQEEALKEICELLEASEIEEGAHE